jgi:hypothetical protein
VPRQKIAFGKNVLKKCFQKFPKPEFGLFSFGFLGLMEVEQELGFLPKNKK